MSFMDSSIDVAVALGKGVYSVGQDVALGIQRTGEGLGLGSDGRIANIGYENRAMVSLLEDFFRYGSRYRTTPLFKSIVYVLEDYSSYFPDKVIAELAKEAGIGAGYPGGRMVIGKKLADAVATRI